MASSTLVRTAVFCTLLFGCLLAPSSAQVDPAIGNVTSQDPNAARPLDETTKQALERLAMLLTEKRAAQAAAVQGGKTATAADLEKEIRDLDWQFAGLASRLDVQDFESPQKRQFDLQQELEQLVRPLIQTIKDATEEPRQAADLRSRIELLQQRQSTAEQALRSVERTRDALPLESGARAEAERELKERWRPTIESLRGEILVLHARLLGRADSQKSVFTSLTQTVQNFVQSSGLSLLLSALVFVAVFFGLRLLLGRVLQRTNQGRGFSVRLLEVLFQALSLLLAIAATLVVPYVRNDWLLLAVCIVFLIGAGWVLVRTLPQFFEQIRLVLNVGGVREGERLMVDGLPFRVEALRMYSRLQNPDLEGGVLRVPIQDLIGKQSRRSAPDEPWFPCRSGDIVLLADGVLGPVRIQTPEIVVVLHLGAPRTYPTGAFLLQQPRNLSRGFVISTTFGLDYAHQAEATTEVPKRLHAALTHGLASRLAADQLLSLRVELAAASASSLDYTVLAQFAGTAANRYAELQRLLQALLVDACTANRWTIPFPQVTVHNTVPKSAN